LNCDVFLIRNDEKTTEETTMAQAKRVVLASRPVGEPKASDFRIEDYAPQAPLWDARGGDCS